MNFFSSILILFNSVFSLPFCRHSFHSMIYVCFIIHAGGNAVPVEYRRSIQFYWNEVRFMGPQLHRSNRPGAFTITTNTNRKSIYRRTMGAKMWLQLTSKKDELDFFSLFLFFSFLFILTLIRSFVQFYSDKFAFYVHQISKAISILTNRHRSIQLLIQC